MAVGFDFGTTNSLMAVVDFDRAVPVLDRDTGLPFPSAVRFEGAKTILGREARESLGEAGLGIHGDTIRSPKFQLGKDRIEVGGVERDPIQIVASVIKYIKERSLEVEQRRDALLKNFESAVVTIPVTMNGPKRKALRDAFVEADTEIVQFIHEPFAALYGYIRNDSDQAATIRRLEKRDVLVVDWGGGTLDLTLCRIQSGRIKQRRNGGSDEVGGDKFDETIRNEVVRRWIIQQDISEPLEASQDVDLQLLQQSESGKIDLSDGDEFYFYVPTYFQNPDIDLEYRLVRAEFDEIVDPLINKGLDQIQTLLWEEGVSPSQVDLCLVAGGMASMPAIAARLNEMFGPDRVEIPDNSQTLVAEGAAWVAHDGQKLRLARQIELQLARGSYLPIVKQNVEVPGPHDNLRIARELYCTDPSDGSAVFNICSPSLLTDNPQSFEPRTTLGHLSVEVSDQAQPFDERLAIVFRLDHDLIMHVDARSTLKDARDSGKFYDLEFTIDLPTTEDGNGPD